MSRDERTEYWNEKYFDYWNERVRESGSGQKSSTIVQNDFVVPADDIFAEILQKCGFKDGLLLDVGCAWGRMFPLFSSLGMRICGIDISLNMVERARNLDSPSVIEVKTASAEEIPYPNDYFDYIVCFGVFDATFQDQAISEFLRVLKIDGKLMVTGKNNAYHADDREARLAEQGARRKGEPNYFTDLHSLRDQIRRQGHEIISEFYFERRGDFGQGRYLETMPEWFYEYCLVVKKKNHSREFFSFSYSYSLCGGSL